MHLQHDREDRNKSVNYFVPLLTESPFAPPLCPSKWTVGDAHASLGNTHQRHSMMAADLRWFRADEAG